MSDKIKVTSREYLDSNIAMHYSKIIGKYNFTRISEYHANGRAIYEYQNEFFRLKFMNDRGVMECEIASIYDPVNYRSIDSIYKLIRLSQFPNETTNSWDLRMILKKRLSCEEQVAAIDLNYSLIVSLLDKENYKKTWNELEELEKVK